MTDSEKSSREPFFVLFAYHLVLLAMARLFAAKILTCLLWAVPAESFTSISLSKRGNDHFPQRKTVELDCGILAICDSTMSPEDLRLKTLTLQRLVRHRGPDGSGIHVFQVPDQVPKLCTRCEMSLCVALFLSLHICMYIYIHRPRPPRPPPQPLDFHRKPQPALYHLPRTLPWPLHPTPLCHHLHRCPAPRVSSHRLPQTCQRAPRRPITRQVPSVSGLLYPNPTPHILTCRSTYTLHPTSPYTLHPTSPYTLHPTSPYTLHPTSPYTLNPKAILARGTWVASRSQTPHPTAKP